MKAELHSDTDMTLRGLDEQGVELAGGNPELHFGAMQMFVSGLAMCTYNVLATYGERFDVGGNGITIRVQWTYDQKPYRIAHIDMNVRWPRLPEKRLDAAMRVAAMCTLHNTLQQSVEVDTMVDR